MAVTYDFQTPGVSTSAADTQEDIRNIAEMSWVWHVNASPHSLTNKPTGLIEAFYTGSSNNQNYYNLRAYDGTNLVKVNFKELFVDLDGPVLTNTVGARGNEFIAMGVAPGYYCESLAPWSIHADYGNTGTSTYDPILALVNQGTERARIYTDTSDSHKLKFDVGGSDQMVIDSSGKVGIGISLPVSTLHVQKNQAAATVIRVQNGTANSAAQAALYVNADGNNFSLINYPDADTSNANITRFISTASGSKFIFAPDSTDTLTVDDGNVGIGTSSPQVIFESAGQSRFSDGGSTANSSFLDINPTGSVVNISSSYYGTGSYVPIDFYTGGLQRLRIDSAGKVGIGTSSPSRLLDLEDTSTNVFVSLVTDPSRDVGILFGDTDSDIRGQVYYQNNVDYMSFYTAGSNKMVIDNSGNIEVKTGNLVIGTSGKGIDFSATSDAAGATSELLDDYEEGTFTPSYISSNGNLTPADGEYTVARDGSYTKIGNCVFFRLRMSTDTINLSGATGTVRISGLPFTANNDATYIHYPASILTQNWGANPPQSCQVIPGTSLIYLYRDKSSTGNLTGNTISDLSTGSNNNDVTITGHYYI